MIREGGFGRNGNPVFLCLPIYAYFRYTITNILIRSVKTGTAWESVRRSVLACRQAGLSGTFHNSQRQAAPGGPRGVER